METEKAIKKMMELTKECKGPSVLNVSNDLFKEMSSLNLIDYICLGDGVNIPLFHGALISKFEPGEEFHITHWPEDTRKY